MGIEDSSQLAAWNFNYLIPDLVEKIKTSSNKWINQERLSKFNFAWQKGYGAFTYSNEQIDSVAKYILSQEEHHKRRHFLDEYLEMLKRNGVEFKNEYLFEFFDEI